MAVHLEMIVAGPPVSNQTRTAVAKSRLLAWRATVTGEAQARYSGPLLLGPVKAAIVNFYRGDGPPVDVDNMSKPIHDALESIVYVDDRQIHQAQITHLDLGASFALEEASRLIVDAIGVGDQFVYIRIEDPVDPFPLPG